MWYPFSILSLAWSLRWLLIALTDHYHNPVSHNTSWFYIITIQTQTWRQQLKRPTLIDQRRQTNKAKWQITEQQQGIFFDCSKNIFVFTTKSELDEINGDAHKDSKNSGKKTRFKDDKHWQTLANKWEMFGFMETNRIDFTCLFDFVKFYMKNYRSVKK